MAAAHAIRREPSPRTNYANDYIIPSVFNRGRSRAGRRRRGRRRGHARRAPPAPGLEVGLRARRHDDAVRSRPSPADGRV